MIYKLEASSYLINSSVLFDSRRYCGGVLVRLLEFGIDEYKSSFQDRQRISGGLGGQHGLTQSNGLDVSNQNQQASKQRNREVGDFESVPSDHNVGLAPFLVTPIALIAALFLMVWGGDRWIDGRRLLGGFLWGIGLFCCISGSGGILFGGPINFWSIVLSPL
jgi:hypothetical protein